MTKLKNACWIVAAMLAAWWLSDCTSLPRDPMATADAALRLLQCAEPVVVDLQAKRAAEAEAAVKGQPTPDSSAAKPEPGSSSASVAAPSIADAGAP